MAARRLNLFPGLRIAQRTRVWEGEDGVQPSFTVNTQVAISREDICHFVISNLFTNDDIPRVYNSLCASSCCLSTCGAEQNDCWNWQTYSLRQLRSDIKILLNKILIIKYYYNVTIPIIYQYWIISAKVRGRIIIYELHSSDCHQKTVWAR